MNRKLAHICWLPLFLFAAYSLNAHESRPAYLELTQTAEESYNVLWKVPANGPQQRLSLNLKFSAEIKHTSLPTASYQNGAHVERSSIICIGGLDGSEIYIEGLSKTMTDTLARIQRLDGNTQIERLSPESPSLVIEITPSSIGVSKTYTILGVQHIFEGIDHLLFVACLVLIAGLGRKLLITITGFTLAHSVTLALASLDLVKLPIPPVEAVIALSVIFLATEIVRGDKQGLTYCYPVAVSITFGLLHGFGFAAVLNEIGLPQNDLPLALLFFNVGVEIGQLLFIALLLASAKIALGFSNHLISDPSHISLLLQKSQRVGVYVIGTLASYWALERVIGFWV